MRATLCKRECVISRHTLTFVPAGCQAMHRWVSVCVSGPISVHAGYESSSTAGWLVDNSFSSRLWGLAVQDHGTLWPSAGAAVLVQGRGLYPRRHLRFARWKG